MIRLTKMGVLFLGVLVLFYLASLTSQSGLLLLLIGIVAGCYAVNLVLAWQTIRRLEIHPPRNIHLGEGQKSAHPWRILNPGRRAAGFVQGETAAGLLFRLPRLAPGAEANIVPDLIFWKRGVYSYAQVGLASSYPFGLVKAARRLQLPGEVVVYPAVYPAPVASAAGYDAVVGGKFKGRRRSSSGAHFAGVRPLQPGDSLKQIHWRSSSKGLGLMVKIFDEELAGRIAVIMDSGHAGDAKTFDDCIRAAGSLVFAALDAGHHIEWTDLTHRRRLILSPFDDGHELLDRLARLHAERGSLTAQALQEAVDRVSVRSAIHFVLTESLAAVWETAACLKAQGRTVSVYLPRGARIPGNCDGVPVFTYTEQELQVCA